jgi:glycosyltransferase involved in cell wall biosynthesis
MWVNKAITGDCTVVSLNTRREKMLAALRSRLASLVVKTLKTKNPILHTPALLPSQWVKRINESDADCIHLHWVAGEMLSIADIGHIKKPVVWTLHDMWAFCGAEHLAWDERWCTGYSRENRPPHESGFDLNRWTWRRKCNHWHQPIHIISPSHWLADCVRRSALMSDWPVKIIPNPIDTARWSPIPQRLARELLQLPADVPLMLFGAMGGTTAFHKGFDLLVGALENLRGNPSMARLELVVFGQLAPMTPLVQGLSTHYVGHLYDDLTLRTLYSAADVMVVPSRQEAFGQTASEAHACGTPVVAFNTGGLPDIVEHQHTGYLAKAFDIEDLAFGIEWVLSHRKVNRLGELARQRAVAHFDQKVVAKQYQQFYAQLLS